jgi:hypothetical protein
LLAAKMRTLSLKGGGRIVETSVSRDDNAHSYAYRMVSSPLPVGEAVGGIDKDLIGVSLR